MDLTLDIALLRKDLNNIPQKAIPKNLAESAKKEQELKDACDGFEELFVHKLLQVMRNAGVKSDFISGGRGEEIFQDMLDENYAKLITNTGALGLSKMIFEHTKKFI